MSEIIDGIRYSPVDHRSSPFYVVYWSDSTGMAGYDLYRGYKYTIVDSLEVAKDTAANKSASNAVGFASYAFVDYGQKMVYQKWNWGDPSAVVVDPAPFIIEPIEEPLEPLDPLVPIDPIKAAGGVGVGVLAIGALYLLTRKKR